MRFPEIVKREGCQIVEGRRKRRLPSPGSRWLVSGDLDLAAARLSGSECCGKRGRFQIADCQSLISDSFPPVAATNELGSTCDARFRRRGSDTLLVSSQLGPGPQSFRKPSVESGNKTF